MGTFELASGENRKSLGGLGAEISNEIGCKSQFFFAIFHIKSILAYGYTNLMRGEHV